MARGQVPPDHGIGGTGVAPADPEDRGIGGTGVVGTVRRLAGLVVSDLPIVLPACAPVTLDGRAASRRDLKLGHVVRVLADRQADLLTAKAIAVTSEVIGRIERVGHGELTVLGQAVATQNLVRLPWWRVGTRVAVAGLRRPDGVIMASLIERRRPGLDRVAGPVDLRKGVLSIGALRLRSADPALAGQRAVVTGSRRLDALVVRSGMRETALLANLATREFLIEALVQRDANGLRTGSGLHFIGLPNLDDIADASPAVAVVAATLQADGRLAVDSVRMESQVGRQGHGGASTSVPGQAPTTGARSGLGPTAPARGSVGEQRSTPSRAGATGRSAPGK